MNNLVNVCKILTLNLLLITTGMCYAQEDTALPADTIFQVGDSLIAIVDSTSAGDSLKISTQKELVISPDAITAMIIYSSSDSIRMDMDERRIYLFNKADISYEKINLKADYVEISFDSNIVYARGVPDSTGRLFGNPVFKEGEQQFDAKVMKYNYETKKGIIQEIFTKEGDGYMHGKVVKKLPDDVILIYDGSYTTCDLECPHFQIRFKKAKVIPDDKIITGPAYLEIEGIPTPLFVPFGYFPNKKGQASGILIPQYGEELRRGFFLNEGGYYFGISDYLDLALRGSIYSKGSWGLKTTTNYKKRYKYSGALQLNFANNLFGDPKVVSEFSRERDFFINWRHAQDPKARPKSSFSANVNAGTSTYNRNNSYNPNQFLQNQLSSSVSYNTSFGRALNFSANMNHNQNTQTKMVNLTLPEISLTSNRFSPFKRKTVKGKQLWYEKITASYAFNTKNYINTYDSLLFANDVFDRFSSGVRHSVPISTNINMLKYFNLTPTITYNERWYFKHFERTWVSDTLGGRFETDTISGFSTARDYSFNTALRTTIYGMFTFKKGYIKAIRHKVVPNIGFSYTPDFSRPELGYYQHIQRDSVDDVVKLYRFDNTLYGAPPMDKSGKINISISNNLEMKVRTPKDSIREDKKIILIEKFDIGTFYDIARDSLNWSKIYLNGYTRLFQNLNVQYASLWDPYIISPTDSTFRRNEDKFEWVENRRLAHWDRTQWNFSLNWSKQSGTATKKKSDRGTQEEVDDINRRQGAYVDFNVPWRFNISYNLNYSKDRLSKYVNTSNPNDIIQTLRVNGELNLTDKWKITADVGYDLANKDFSTAVIDIYRDLHCWEMSFRWIPFGHWKSYMLTINVKSAVLQDLKLTKKKDWRDY